MNATFASPTIPAYHDNALLVQMAPGEQPVAGPLGGMVVAGATAAGYAPSIGFSALAFFEDAGLVRRVVPIARATVGNRPAGTFSHTPDGRDMRGTPGGYGATFALAATVPGPQFADKRDAGLSLIELRNGQSSRQLQAALAQDPAVKTVSRVPVRYLAVREPISVVGSRPSGIAAAAPPPGMMWNLRKIGWYQARALTGFKDALDIRVAVLDTGLDRHHPDISGPVDYVWEHSELPQASSEEDIVGHGTHVAGTIGANIGNAFGIDGICRVKLAAWKVFNDTPTFSGGRYVYIVDHVMYLRALLDCVDQQPHVVNLSLGGEGAPSRPEAEAIQAMMAQGTTVVAAMGNNRSAGSPLFYPAAIPGVIAVGSTGITDAVSYFSNSGNHIAICAPGEAIWSTLPRYPGQTEWRAIIQPDGTAQRGEPEARQSDYVAWNGTSMAAPHVSAAVALYLANGGRPARVRDALIASSDKVAGMRGADFHPDYGYGRLNLRSLLQQAKARASRAVGAGHT